MSFVKELGKNLAVSVVVTLGMLSATTVYASGLGAKIEEKTRKAFNKKKES